MKWRLEIEIEILLTESKSVTGGIGGMLTVINHQSRIKS